MPTKVPHNCFQCSKVGTDEAKLKSCWDSRLCPARRHYHRNRGKLSLERKAKRLSVSSSTVEIAVNIPTGFAASIIFYRERQDAPVHAIAAEVWQMTEDTISTNNRSRQLIDSSWQDPDRSHQLVKTEGCCIALRTLNPCNLNISVRPIYNRFT